MARTLLFRMVLRKFSEITNYGLLQCFSLYFCKLKEIGILQPIFPDYVISCDDVVKHTSYLYSSLVIIVK